MLTFSYPFLIALLPTPLLIWLLVPAHRETRQGLIVPFLARLVGKQSANGAIIPRRSMWRWLSLGLCWVCIVIATMRPQVLEPPVTKEIPMRDLLLAVDLSGSMETRDFKNADGETVERLTATKEVLSEFLAKRNGDRVGLIFFGSAPFVQAPFTDDLRLCGELLDEAQVRMAGPQTAFGDALGLAINQFEQSHVEDRVLIALTDGNDTASQVPPQKAAQIAKDKGIVIHTIAVGDPRAAGEEALDEVTLEKVAESTGGVYAHAADRNQLAEIYRNLDKLETRKVQSISHRPRRDVYWWPLALALAISMLQIIVILARHVKPNRYFAVVGPRVGVASITPMGLFAMSENPFHFIRSEWLLAIVPAAGVWWVVRRQTDSHGRWRGVIAEHLLPHLLSGQSARPRLTPVDWVALIWLITIIAVAGPTWRHEPAPFARDMATLAIVVKVSPSMLTEDLQPSRLGRATLKIQDLMEQRGGAKTSLIAYSGTAHVVMPATTDGRIINSFATSLDPRIMPRDGDAAADALELADQTLVNSGGGTILWITDSIATEQTTALSDWREHSQTELYLFPPLMAGAELDTVEESVRSVRGRVIRLTADHSDVRRLASIAKLASIPGDDVDTRWAESGYWLTPVLACMLLPCFRQGWMVSVDT